MARGRGAAPTRGRGAPKSKRGRGRAPLPFDAQAQRESAELGNEAGDTRASLAAKFSRVQAELGFGSGAANPYSGTAENKTSLENNSRGIVNTAGNQLYAGSTANGLSAARSTYDRNQKALEDSYAAAQSDYTRGLGQTKRDEAIGDTGIEGEAIERAVATEPAPGVPGRKTGRGKATAPTKGRNVRGRQQGNARARAIAAKVKARNRGRGQV